MQEEQDARQWVSEACGFVAIVVGTFLLHATRELDVSLANIGRLTMPGLPLKGSAPLPRSDSSELQLRRVAAMPSNDRTAGSSNGWL